MRDKITLTARDEMLATYVQANSLGERFAHAMCSGRVGATLFLLSTSDIDTIGQSLLELVKQIEHDFPIIYGDPSAPEPAGVLRGTSPILAPCDGCNPPAPRGVGLCGYCLEATEGAPKESTGSATVLQSDQADGVATCA